VLTWKVGDLVYYSHREEFPDCKCTYCKKEGGSYGIVTEAWCDEDDTTALLIDFHVGVAVFREAEQKYLRAIHGL